MSHCGAILRSIVFNHVDHKKPAADLECAPDLTRCGLWVIEMMEEQHRNRGIELAIFQRQLLDIATAKLNAAASTESPARSIDHR